MLTSFFQRTFLIKSRRLPPPCLKKAFFSCTTINKHTTKIGYNVLGCNLRLQRSQNIWLVLRYIINVSKVTTTMKATSTPLSLSHRPLVDAGLCQIGSHTTLKPNVTFDNLTLLDYVAFKNGHLLPSSFFLFPDVLFSLQ